MESTFQTFGGITRAVLLDNARALGFHYDPSSREVVLQPLLDGTRSGRWRRAASLRMAKWVCSWARRAWTRPIWRLRAREAIVTGYLVLFTPATALVAQLAKANGKGRLRRSSLIRQAEAADHRWTRLSAVRVRRCASVLPARQLTL